MNIARALACCGLASMLLAASSDSTVQVPQAEIDAVNARWTSLGVKLPEGGLVLAEPFEPPYSNRSFVVPPEWFWDVGQKHRDNPNFMVSAAAMRADLPVLRLALEKVYVAYRSMQQRGWDWDGFFAGWDSDLARNGDTQISLHAALAPWERVADFQPGGHLGPFIPGFHDFDSSSSLTAELASAPLEICTAIRFQSGKSVALAPADVGRQPHAVHAWDGVLLTPAWYVDYPERDGEASTIDCGKSISLQMTAQRPRGSAGPLYQPLEDGIAYLRAPYRFDYENDRALGDVLSKEQGLGKERVLLFDLRGNAGGSAPVNLLSHWFSQEEIDAASAVGDRYTLDSCFKNGLMFNEFQFLSYTLKPPLSRDTRQWMQRGVDSLIGTTLADGCDVKENTILGTPTPPQTPFSETRSNHQRTRVVVLIDNGCSSDCGRMADVLSRLPETVIAGTSINGAGRGGTAVPGLLVLPHTRIPFIMGTYMGTKEGARDVTVDVLLPTDQSQEMTSLVALAHYLAR